MLNNLVYRNKRLNEQYFFGNYDTETNKKLFFNRKNFILFKIKILMSLLFVKDYIEFIFMPETSEVNIFLCDKKLSYLVKV